MNKDFCPICGSKLLHIDYSDLDYESYIICENKNSNNYKFGYEFAITQLKNKSIEYVRRIDGITFCFISEKNYKYKEWIILPVNDDLIWASEKEFKEKIKRYTNLL